MPSWEVRFGVWWSLFAVAFLVWLIFMVRRRKVEPPPRLCARALCLTGSLLGIDRAVTWWVDAPIDRPGRGFELCLVAFVAAAWWCLLSYVVDGVPVNDP